jgi:cell wall integrity and stress response component
MTMPTVVTESGVVITRTVVITPTSSSRPIAAPAPEKKSNVGAIAGGVAGGILALLAVAGGILFVLWRKRKQRAHEQDGEGGSSGITRNVSTMSRAGLLGGRSEKTPPPLVTNFGSQRSRHDDESITPITPSTRRYSQPILVDSRLNPNAVLTFHGANASRESLASIDDSRDYGRQLNVRNP